MCPRAVGGPDGRTGVCDRLATAGRSVPLGRVGTAEEVAQVVGWLLSDASAYVSGTVVDIGGGR